MAELHNVQTLITQHIDLWTGAVKDKSSAGRGGSSKRELYGIKKLRELILELAVRGKLVAQDPNDEPASVLLERIAAEKAELIKQGKIKKPKKLPEISEEEKPFELPVGWEWTRLGEVVEVLDHLRKPVSKKDRVEGNIPYYGASGVVDYISDYIFDEDLVLIGEDGAKWGAGEYTAYQVTGKTWVNNHVHATRPDRRVIDDKLLVTLIAQQDLQKYITGITVPKLNQAKLLSIVLNVPPIREQRRIVIKVDELMALCDQLEQQTESSLDAHQTLVQTLLDTLLQSADAEELEQNWQRLSAHFDLLFTTEQSIEQLKQTILQLAVMGKLVPQDPNDEPAAELLKRIAAEKEELVKQKKIKKQKPLPPISDDEKPFQLPKGWEWCRFSDVFRDLKYGTSQKSDYGVDGVPVLRIPNVVKGYLCLEDLKYSNLSLTDVDELSLSIGDLLFIRSNGSLGIVGRCAVVDMDIRGFAYAGYLVRARLNTQYCNSEFIYVLMNSAVIRSQIEKPIRTTSGVKNINSTELGRLCFALPTYNEQQRIVAKVDQLMALCDLLKAKVADSKTIQLNLTDALVAQAV